jgi:hypothetical protein
LANASQFAEGEKARRQLPDHRPETPNPMTGKPQLSLERIVF